MRIGKFAEKNQLSIDAIRHYMEIGLLLPEKRGGQYFFDSDCQKNLDDLRKLKSMGFTLNEVKTIFLFRGLGKLTPYQEDDYYKAFFINKKHALDKEINKITNYKKNLEMSLEELNKKVKNKTHSFGIDFRTLGLFKCLKCNGDLKLLEGQINNNQIINGKLGCDCGNQYTIESGILHATNSIHYESPEGMLKNDFFVGEYIHLTDHTYLEKLYLGLDWLYKRINFEDLKNKVIMELGSGLGFFLRYIYNELPESTVYIAVDHNIERHLFLKQMLEATEIKKNVIFLCTDFLHIPIKDEAVDYIFDLSGTSNYSFEHEDFLLGLVQHLLKSDTYILGSYILFKKFSTNSLIQEKYRRNFLLKNIKNYLDVLHFKKIEDKISDDIDQGGKFEDYFVEGEKVYGYLYFGKR